MIFHKKPKNRVFDYEPRFYNPEEDEDERRKRRLKFRYGRVSQRRSKSPIILLVLLGIILYFYLRFGG